MFIRFSPIRSDDRLSLARKGDALIINGTAYDFSGLPEGAMLPRDAVRCDWLVSEVRRTDGVLDLTLMLPHGAEAPERTRFPAPVLVSQDGPVTLPPYAVDAEDAA